MADVTKDIFNYSRTISSDTLPGGSSITFDLGDGIIALVDSATIQYGHQTSTQMEAGSNALYIIHGIPQGSLTLATVVGPTGFFGNFSDFLSGAGCGNLSTLTMSLTNVNDCPKYNISANSIMKLEGIMPASVTLSFSAADLKIATRIDAIFGKLSIADN